MKRNTIEVVIAGGGAAGLAVASGLALDGFSVTVLEKARRVFTKQSGPRGGQARLHGGWFYANSPVVAAAIHADRSLLSEIPEAVVNLDSHYYVDRAELESFMIGCSAAGLPYREVPQGRLPLSSQLQPRLVIVATGDLVIDVERLRSHLSNDLIQAGGRMVCRAQIVGAQRRHDEITCITAETPNGLRDYRCDFFVNVSGAALSQVSAGVNASAALREHLELVATPVLRVPWPFTIDPQILQFYGVLDNLALVPVGNSRLVSIATRGGYATAEIVFQERGLLDSERQRLLRLVAEGFDLLSLADPQTMTWCVKSQLLHPTLKDGGERAANRLATVIPGRMFGGAKNELAAAPGKLGSVLHLRDVVRAEILQYFGLEEEQRAA